MSYVDFVKSGFREVRRNGRWGALGSRRKWEAMKRIEIKWEFAVG
jgi:hypothetical protein